MGRSSALALALRIAIALLATPRNSAAVDADLNGIDDGAEIALARRFCPVLALHGPDTEVHSNTVPVYPVPVEIMGLGGAVPGEGLPADRLFVIWRAQPLDYPFGDHWVGAMGWSPPLPENDPAHDYRALRDEPPERRTVAPPAQPSGIYHLRFHWEYGNPDVNEPEEWYDVWQNGNAWTRPGSVFPPTAYAHLRRCDDAGCAAPPSTIFIQYWFFFPFNDWVNNHEGDWEGINVIASSEDTTTAALLDVEYFAHRVHIVRAPAVPLAEHALVIDATHPVAFVGGHGREEGCIGGTGEGEASHGFYPTAGRFEAMGEGDFLGCFDRADEEVAVSAGPTIHWSDLDVHVLPNPDAIDTAAEPERAWLAADLLWGTRRVPSVGGEIAEDVGNWAPHGPAYNREGRWGRVARDSATRDYASPADPHPLPYLPAELGWVPFAFFLDPFTGMTANEPGDLNDWTLGTGSWTLAGGGLIGVGNGTPSRSNRAFFQVEWPPGGYVLPFVSWNARAARLVAEIALLDPLPVQAAVGLVTAGAEEQGGGNGQLRVVLRRTTGGGHAVEVRVRSDAGDSLVAGAPIPDPGTTSHRLEVLTLAPETGGGLFHDVWYDGALVLGSIATPGGRDEARGLVADGAARARFDEVSLAGLRLEPNFRHPPFGALIAAPTPGADIYACPQLLAWSAVDEKSDDGIATQELALSTDGGVVWQLLASLAGDVRSTSWLPPAVPADRPALLRLTLTDVEGDRRALLSPSFWLRAGTPPASVLAPSGGEEWVRGAFHTIRWSAPCRAAIDLTLSTDGGATFTHTIATGESNDGAHAWFVPDYLPASHRCRVKLAGGGLPPGISPADFTLGWNGQLAGGDFEHAEPWLLRPSAAFTRGDGSLAHGIGPPPFTLPLEGAASLWADARAGGTVPPERPDHRLPGGIIHPDPPWRATARMELIAESETLPVPHPGEIHALHFELYAVAMVQETPSAPASAGTTVILEAVYLDSAGDELATFEITHMVVQRDLPGAIDGRRNEVTLLDPAPLGAIELRFRLRLQVASTAFGPGARAEAQAVADALWFETPIALDSARSSPAPGLRVDPNPTTGAAKIAFHLPAAQAVTLGLYGARGALVARLLERTLRPAGWNEIEWDGAGLPAGIYFWRLMPARGAPVACKWLVTR